MSVCKVSATIYADVYRALEAWPVGSARQELQFTVSVLEHLLTITTSRQSNIIKDEKDGTTHICIHTRGRSYCSSDNSVDNSS